MPNTREIHQRSNFGITVTLYADFCEDDSSQCEEIWLRVENPDGNEDFEIREIDPHKALEVFYHPYASANRLLVAGVV